MTLSKLQNFWSHPTCTRSSQLSKNWATEVGSIRNLEEHFAEKLKSGNLQLLDCKVKGSVAVFQARTNRDPFPQCAKYTFLILKGYWSNIFLLNLWWKEPRKCSLHPILYSSSTREIFSWVQLDD